MSHEARRRALYRLAAGGQAASLIRRSAAIEGRAYRLANRYVGGQTLQEALATLERFHAEGLATSVDFFGEAQTDPAAVEGIVGEYLRLASALRGMDRDVNVWVDPSNLGLDISAELCRHEVGRIAAALAGSARLQVRAHDSARMDRILDLVIALGADGAPVVPTLPANLRRSPEDAKRLIEAALPVLLVKGASLEPRTLAHAWGEQTDMAFIRLAHQLHEGGVELAIGTHDPVIREALLASLPGIRVEMLLGIRPADACELAARGHHVRVYVPYGGDWVRYWVRRLAAAPTLGVGLSSR